MEAMIAYIRGKVVAISETKVVLDVHDMGYQVHITSRDAAAIPSPGEQVKLHTYLNVKEDAMQLFGFLDSDDMEVFKLLINVNGIGPKAGLGVLSALTADDLRFAVLSDDVKSLTKAPGVGTKTAKKLILELKDKLSLEDAFEKRLTNNEAAGSPAVADAKSDAVQALVALGYASADALKAVNRAEVTETMSTEEILKAALKNMSFL